MAVTSIWPIKGRVDRVINYARNPEKTTEASYEELASLHAKPSRDRRDLRIFFVSASSSSLEK